MWKRASIQDEAEKIGREPDQNASNPSVTMPNTETHREDIGLLIGVGSEEI